MRLRRFSPFRTSLVAAAMAVTLSLAACGDDNALDENAATPAPGAGDKGSLTVGSAGFTESQLMAEMYALLLEKAGYQTSIKTVSNRELYEPALEKGDIDVVPEYAATMAEFLNLKANGPDAEPVASSDVDETVDELTQLAGDVGLKVLEPAQAVDQNAFVVTQEFADANGLTTLTDLGELGQSVKLAATEECPDRPFCQPGLEDIYGIDISKLEPLGFGTPQVKQAVQSGRVDLGLVATTDGTLGDLGLVVLEDDQGLQNADNLIPVVNAESAGAQDVADALNQLAGVLTTEDLAGLNKQVDAERQQPEDVAREYLEGKGLL